MYEYTIENKQTLELDIIFGYTAKDAFERAKLLPFEWVVLGREYID